MTVPAWPSEWHRAILWACTLQVVADLQPDAYGYHITTQLGRRELGVVPGGTLYPILKRLESDGLVTSDWRAGDIGPGRKHYTVTPAGHQRLADVGREWAEFTQVTMSLLKGHPDGA